MKLIEDEDEVPNWARGALALLLGWVGSSIIAISVVTQWQYYRAGQQLERTGDLEAATRAVHEATAQVHRSVHELATETGKAQRLALWVGVGTALVGAIVGGFAGAVAARVIGS